MTPAINLLKKSKCKFKLHKYKHDSACTNFGAEAVEKLGLDEKEVFKTLLVELSPKHLVVCVIPVCNTLCLKKVANCFSVKKAMMADKNEAQKTTGYLLGGISPLGQKRRLETIIHSSANSFETIFVSGGKRGLDIELSPQDLIKLLEAKSFDIVS